jgi:hypothetical protein
VTGDDRLRSELEALERAAPGDTTPRQARSTPRTRFVLVAATILAAIVVTSVATDPLRWFPLGVASPSVRPRALAETRIGDFILSISSPKSVWQTNETIEVTAALTYVGEGADMTIGQGIPPIGIELTSASATGPRLVPIQLQPCVQYPVSAVAPLSQAFRKGVPMTQDGRPVEDAEPFDRAFLDDPDLRLPPGDWLFTAMTQFDERGCGDDYELEAAIVLRVVSDGEPMSEQTELPAPSDDDPLSVTGVLEGDANLEGGCMWLRDAAGDQWEILWPDGYAAEFRGDLPVGGGDVPVIVREGGVVASEGDLVTVSGHRPPGVGSHCMVGIVFAATEVTVANVDCGLPASDCNMALGVGSQVLRDQHADPDLVRVTWGRGLRVWHAELHACWDDGRYILVDVLGPVDAIPPQASDLSVSIRENGWDNPPCD